MGSERYLKQKQLQDAIKYTDWEWTTGELY